MQFIDEVKINVKAGNGGNGRISFLRLKYRPKAGPDGGDGGRGGSIIFKADPDLNTLIDYKYTRHFEAESGENGKKYSKTGKSGKDLILKIVITPFDIILRFVICPNLLILDSREILSILFISSIGKTAQYVKGLAINHFPIYSC